MKVSVHQAHQTFVKAEFSTNLVDISEFFLTKVSDHLRIDDLRIKKDVLLKQKRSKNEGEEKEKAKALFLRGKGSSRLSGRRDAVSCLRRSASLQILWGLRYVSRPRSSGTFLGCS